MEWIGAKFHELTGLPPEYLVAIIFWLTVFAIFWRPLVKAFGGLFLIFYGMFTIVSSLIVLLTWFVMLATDGRQGPHTAPGGAAFWYYAGLANWGLILSVVLFGPLFAKMFGWLTSIPNILWWFVPIRRATSRTGLTVRLGPVAVFQRWINDWRARKYARDSIVLDAYADAQEKEAEVLRAKQAAKRANIKLKEARRAGRTRE